MSIEDEHKVLKFAYGPIPAKRDAVLQNDLERKRDQWIDRLVRYYSFADTNSLAYDLKKGEIYEIDWGQNVGSEFSGRHYGVVLVDSGPENPLVFVCPLKSNHKKIVNRHSDVLLGEIEGLPTGKDTVAVLNQARALDKIRVYTKFAIGENNFNCRSLEQEEQDYEILRLDNGRVSKIVNGIAHLVFGLPLKPSNKRQSGGNV